MASPGIIKRDPNGDPTGVFGRSPGATPKYAKQHGPVDAEHRESMARLFVKLSPKNLRSFLSTVSERARPLATVLAGASKNIPLTAGGGGGSGTGFVDFLLTNTSEAFHEKTQIVDTLTDNYVAFYSGEEPPVFSYSGVLLNTYQDDQRVWMLQMYREILRGSRLATRNLTAHLRYDSFIVTGYLESLQLGLSGDTDLSASQFSFTMRMKKMVIITEPIGHPVGWTRLFSEQEFFGDITDDKEERIVTATPETNSIAAQPAAIPATLTAAELLKTRSSLRLQNFTDDQISAVITAAVAAQDNPPEVDARASEDPTQTSAAARVAEAARGTSANVTNPNNASRDGLNGDSNILGGQTGADALRGVVRDVKSIADDVVALKKRVRGRARGNRAVTSASK